MISKQPRVFHPLSKYHTAIKKVHLKKKIKESFDFSLFSNDILKNHFLHSSTITFKNRFRSPSRQFNENKFDNRLRQTKLEFYSAPVQEHAFRSLEYPLDYKTRFNRFSLVTSEGKQYGISDVVSLKKNKVYISHHNNLNQKNSQSVDKAIKIIKIRSQGNAKIKLMDDSYHSWPPSGNGQKGYMIRKYPLVRRSLQFSLSNNRQA